MPTSGSILLNRVQANNEWLLQCKNMHRDESKRIGGFARTARKEAGLSLRELARRMEISAIHLSDLERGNRYWTTGTIERWANNIS